MLLDSAGLDGFVVVKLGVAGYFLPCPECRATLQCSRTRGEEVCDVKVRDGWMLSHWWADCCQPSHLPTCSF